MYWLGLQVWGMVLRQIRHGQSFKDISAMLREMAHRAYYDHHALALAHRIAVLQDRLQSPAVFPELPPFEFPAYGSPDYPDKVPGPELLEIMYMAEMEGGLLDYLRLREQRIDGQ